MCCKNCLGELTSKWSKKFCSKKCAAIFNNKHKHKTKTCKICDSTIDSSRLTRKAYHSRKICDGCYTTSEHTKRYYKDREIDVEAMTVADVKEHCKDKSYSSWTDYVRTHSRRKFSHLHSCISCNYNKHVEICHAKPVADFEDSATIGEINHPSNILALCPNCHWEYDNGAASRSRTGFSGLQIRCITNNA